MIGSVRQTQIWNEATAMTTRELQHALSPLLQSSNAIMLHPYFPYCRVRDQAEFRIFHSIFSSTYSISTKKHEFDFGMFLRMSHEENILSIIEIGPEKWLLILFITIAPMLKIELFESDCKNLDCKVTEEIYICVCAGLLNSVLAVFVFFCGRYSELQLLQKAGVEAVPDYDVFLTVEARCRHVTSKNQVNSITVKDAITEYLVESESLASAKRAARRSTLRRQSVAAATKVAKVFTTSGDSNKVSPAAGYGSSRRTVPEVDDQTRPAKQALVVRQINKDLVVNDLVVQDIDISEEPHTQKLSLSGRSMAKYGPDTSTAVPSDNSEKPCVLEKCEDELDPESRQPVGIPKSMSKVIVKRSSTMGEGYVLQTTNTEIVPLDTPCEGPRLKSLSAKFLGHGRRRSIVGFNRMSFVASKNTYKEKLKSSYEKENFSDVFLLHSSELYYGLMSVVITANSLYLAWWITDFLMLILRLKTAGDVAYLIAVSSIPFLTTFPFLYLAVKSSSILKALCRLKLDIVSAVVEKTESNSSLVKNFKSMCMATVEDKANPRPDLRDLFDTHSGDGISLTLDEFQELVTASKIHLTEQKLRHLYDMMRPAQHRDVTYPVSHPCLLGTW
jgi:hypothetical protein